MAFTDLVEGLAEIFGEHGRDREEIYNRWLWGRMDRRQWYRHRLRQDPWVWKRYRAKETARIIAVRARKRAAEWDEYRKRAPVISCESCGAEFCQLPRMPGRPSRKCKPNCRPTRSCPGCGTEVSGKSRKWCSNRCSSRVWMQAKRDRRWSPCVSSSPTTPYHDTASGSAATAAQSAR